MKLPILCYHMVGEAERRLNISPERLESHVRFFVRRGHKVVLPVPGFLQTPHAVCFTFDDAYESALVNAVPIFERLGVRCAFFAVSSLVGKTSEWDGQLARTLADWPVLEEASRKGFMVGNHTHTHPRLPEVSPEAQGAEVSTCSSALESHGLSGGAFCYPFGAVDESTKTVVGRHFEIGLALGKRPANPDDDPLAIPRIVVAYSDSLPKLLYKIHIRPLLP